MSVIGFRPLDLGDFTNKGQDMIGCVFVVAISVTCACSAGTMSADALRNPTDQSRKVIGFAMGGSIAACVAGGLSNRHPKLSLLALVTGSIVGYLGASTLRSTEIPPTVPVPASRPPSTRVERREIATPTATVADGSNKP